eukprot:g69542.t1
MHSLCEYDSLKFHSIDVSVLEYNRSDRLSGERTGPSLMAQKQEHIKAEDYDHDYAQAKVKTMLLATFNRQKFVQL